MLLTWQGRSPPCLAQQHQAGSAATRQQPEQQQRQVRQQQAEKEVAAVQAAMKERAKQAPAHPIFGVMHPAAARHPAA